MAEPVRIGLIGVGDVAQRDYLPEFHRLSGRARIVAAAARTPERLTTVAERYGIEETTTDYHALLASAEVDAVVNLTPIQMHDDVNRAVLEAGKHLYSEKPIAATASGTAELEHLAKERNLVVVCAPSVAVFPHVRHVAGLLDTGAIGRLVGARAQGLMGVPPWAGFPSDPTPYFAAGAGPAYDMGVYPLHALTTLLGPVRRVTAMVGHVMTSFTVADGPLAGREIPVDVDDNWLLLLDFGEGRLASVTFNSVVQDSRAPWIELYGLDGTIAFHPWDVGARVEVFTPADGWTASPFENSGRSRGPDHHLGIEHLVECLETGRQPVLSLNHARHVLEVIEAAKASSAQEGTVHVESTF
jgi:predicted dehydrogenase